MTESKRKGLPDDPFGQHLAAKIPLKRPHALANTQYQISKCLHALEKGKGFIS
ncbi:hypothetical protein [Shewanella cutis]|uniref:Uncharacterized protein n=1 Tax=Shewanella cutis TaxID=2766780 RepID=A0ABS9QZQ0_9GAMM|nr:hypothetical protein [Shewanella sp. PS-2]MCG9965848.1 hypothetical protein [Shewanella sp. PS-2]